MRRRDRGGGMAATTDGEDGWGRRGGREEWLGLVVRTRDWWGGGELAVRTAAPAAAAGGEVVRVLWRVGERIQAGLPRVGEADGRGGEERRGRE